MGGREEVAVFSFSHLHIDSNTTGQTTVNKKALIHYIISLNDMVHRPL